ncbi:branched-chain amino acid aminotransferase [Bacillus alkalisoli]|uniref:branched-chain amino acid aminotransferase n=1 Tax=Bacillus alkalisoli TaxID=2011008 RepID=UPI000C24DA40|nr:branched-chain amino acid aminotransferase [Bacillus alkalisoli]
MLKKHVEAYIKENSPTVPLTSFEKEYVESTHLIQEDVTVTPIQLVERFSDVYVERCNKESEETLSEEGTSFLEKPISYLKDHKQEFLYIESQAFSIIGVDSVSLELDDIFATYDVMFGLKLQKKYEATLKETMKQLFNTDQPKMAIMFNQQDGVWDMNFALNHIEGFNESGSISENLQLMYHFIFQLLSTIESNYH